MFPKSIVCRLMSPVSALYPETIPECTIDVHWKKEKHEGFVDHDQQRPRRSHVVTWSTRQTRLTGTGSARVTESQPVPAPAHTRGLYPHGFPNP